MKRPTPDSMQIAGQQVLVVGFGVTGQALTRFLSRRGARVTVTDTADEHRMSQHLDTLRSLGVKAEWGEHRTDAFLQTDLILLSPGVDQRIAPLRQARERGIPVWGEIELAARFIAEPIVAVTGTNGKTTTTALLGKMLENSGIQVFVGGNIGDPLIGYVDREEKARVIVAEVSSFQLDTIETFRPEVGLLLNISEDHLDRYLDFDAYVRAKGRLFENQTTTQVAVLNGSDRRVRSLVPDIRSRKLFFTGRRAPERGATIHPAHIELEIDPMGVAELDLADFQLPGRHNQENAAAACLGALALGGTLEGIQAALREFKGLPHRQEPVATIGGVGYVNDSKSTTVDSLVRALACYASPVILIAGGRDKGGGYRPLIEPVRRHVKLLIVLGEAANAIRQTLAGEVAVQEAASVQDAVRAAHRSAVPGDVVLLSPACASFDMFENYRQRGETFRRAVGELE